MASRAVRVQCQAAVEKGQCPLMASEKRRSWRYGKYDKTTGVKAIENFYVKLCPAHADEWDNKRDEKGKEREGVLV